VTILHADDELLPEYASHMIRLAESQPTAGTFFCSAETIDAKGKRVFSAADRYKLLIRPSPASDGIIYLRGCTGIRSLIRGNYIFCPTLCYRRRVIKDRRFTSDYEIVVDQEFTMRLLLEDITICGTPEVLFRYRRHGSNTITQGISSSLLFVEGRKLSFQVAREYEARGWRSLARYARRMPSFRQQLLFYVVKDVLGGRFRSAVVKLSEF